MIVTVKYGEDNSIVVNTDCSVYNLLNYIRRKCSPTEDVIDLSDEKGKVKNLRFKSTEYGKDHVTSRESLVLIAVRNSSTPDGVSEIEEYEAGTTVPKQTLVPLLTSKLTDLHFIAKLNEPRVKSVTVSESNQKMDAKSKKTTSASSLASSTSAAAGGGGAGGGGTGDKKSTKNANAKSKKESTKSAPKNSKA